MNLKEQIAEENPEILFADDFDESLIGIAHRFGLQKPKQESPWL